jgi:hypothetical protein
MITMKEWLELVNYQITEGSDYGWDCYGSNSYMLSSWNGLHDQGGWSFNIIFSTKSQKVYEVEVCDYTHNRAYRMINPDYLKKFNKENVARGEDAKYAWDEVEYVDLDVLEDFIEKATAIRNGEDYDTSVMMNLDLPDDVILQIALAAHKEDITLNDYINKALAHMVEVYKNKKPLEEELES